ncbi:unnamed protein product, partial [Coregonus sp. 'balchen']
TASTANDTTYSEISISRTGRNQPSTDPNGGDPDSQEGSKVRAGGCDPVRVVLVTLCVLLMGAVIGLGFLYISNPQTKNTELQILQAAYDRNLTGLEKGLTADDKCPICADGWMDYGKKCYYFSNSKLTWVESRDKCVSMGGHLVIIDSEEEQTFLDDTVGAKMSVGEDKFWIGLTDKNEEGKWLWVDNTPLDPNKSFWSVFGDVNTEPDDWQGVNGINTDGEDCARMGEKRGTHNENSWFDVNCAGDPDSKEGSKVRAGGCDPVRVVLVTLCVLLMGAVIGLGFL